MTPAGSAPRVRALSFHAGYRCRHTGVCCRSGWDIPVEPEAEHGLRKALLTGALQPGEGDAGRLASGRPVEDALRPISGLPHGARVALSRDAAGRCVFLEADGGHSRCAVHRRLGEGALPSACRQFPRVVTQTPLGVSVTLSHHCPTAAATLFGPVIPSMDSGSPGPEGSALPSGPRGSTAARDPLLRVVDDAAAFPPSWPWEGLDARGALPPFLRPGVLMSWKGLECWERFAIGVLAGEDRTPEAALDVLSEAAEGARRWTPERGPFDAFFEAVLSAPGPSAAALSSRGAPVAPGVEGSAWRLVADCVPHRALLPAAPEGLGEADTRWVTPAWPALGRPIRRFLAAKAFASWLVLQGDGLRTAVLGLRVALGVLRAEAARGCAETGRMLGAGILEEAVRRADLLLVHLADPEALARRLSLGEPGEGPRSG